MTPRVHPRPAGTDYAAARERRRAWLDRLHGDALAAAAEARAAEDTETTVTRQAKVRG